MPVETIPDQAELTSPANGDLLLIRDISAGGDRKITYANLIAGVGAASRFLFAAHDAGGGDNCDAGLNVPWDTEDRKDAGFTHAAGSADITLDAAADYLVHFDVTVDFDSSGSGVELAAWLTLAGVEIAGTRRYAYSYKDASTSGNASIHITKLITTGAASQILRGRVDKISSAGSCTTVANGCAITVEKL
jgi:hypothetical protein